MLNYLIMGLKAGLAAIIDITTLINSKTATAVDAYANMELNTDGTLNHNNIASNDNFITFNENWLEGGNSSNVWVERDNLAGTPGTLNGYDPGAGRLQLNTTRQYGVVETTTTETHTCTFDLTFYDAASGGAILAGPFNYQLTAIKNTL